MAFDLSNRFANLTALSKSIVDAKQKAEELKQQRNRDLANTVLGGAGTVLDYLSGAKNREAQKEISANQNATERYRTDTEAGWRAAQTAQDKAKLDYEKQADEARNSLQWRIAQLGVTKQLQNQLDQAYQTAWAFTGRNLGWQPGMSGGVVAPQWSTDLATARKEQDKAVAYFTEMARQSIASAGLTGPQADAALSDFISTFKLAIGYDAGSGSGNGGDTTPPPIPKGETLGQKVMDAWNKWTGGPYNLPKFGRGSVPVPPTPPQMTRGDASVPEERTVPKSEDVLKRTIDMLLNEILKYTAAGSRFTENPDYRYIREFKRQVDSPGDLAVNDPTAFATLFTRVQEMASRYTKP